MDKNRLILASRSPRRQELLAQVGLDVTVVPADVDETVAPDLTPRAFVKTLAEKKARHVMQRHPDAWVLGADTIVVRDGLILNKPGDKADAARMLACLSGRTHSVFTGYAVGHLARGHLLTGAVETRVTFRALTNPEILWYTGTDEPYDKAGGYAAQGLGAFMVEKIHGSYTSVVGLPVCEIIQALTGLGVIQFEGHQP